MVACRAGTREAVRKEIKVNLSNKTTTTKFSRTYDIQLTINYLNLFSSWKNEVLSLLQKQQKQIEEQQKQIEDQSRLLKLIAKASGVED